MVKYLRTLLAAAVLVLGVPSVASVASAQEQAGGAWEILPRGGPRIGHMVQDNFGTIYGLGFLGDNIWQVMRWHESVWVESTDPFEAGFPRLGLGSNGQVYVRYENSIALLVGNDLIVEPDPVGFPVDLVAAISPDGQLYTANLIAPFLTVIRRQAGDGWVDMVEAPFTVTDLEIDVEGRLVMLGIRRGENRSVVWQFDGDQHTEIGDFPSASYKELVVDPAGGLIVGAGSMLGEQKVDPLRWDGSAWTDLLDAPAQVSLLGWDGCGNLLLEGGSFEFDDFELFKLQGDQLVSLGTGGRTVAGYLNGTRLFGYARETGRGAIWHGTEYSVIDARSLAEIPGACNFQSETDGDVLRLYRAFFNREPDLLGAKYWLAVSASGYNVDQITEDFARSAEFNRDYADTTNSQFLETVYQNVLGRQYDQAGFDYWLDLLDTNQLSRGAVVRWIAANDEFRLRHPH